MGSAGTNPNFALRQLSRKRIQAEPFQSLFPVIEDAELFGSSRYFPVNANHSSDAKEERASRNPSSS